MTQNEKVRTDLFSAGVTAGKHMAAAEISAMIRREGKICRRQRGYTYAKQTD